MVTKDIIENIFSSIKNQYVIIDNFNIDKDYHDYIVKRHGKFSYKGEYSYKFQVHAFPDDNWIKSYKSFGKIKDVEIEFYESSYDRMFNEFRIKLIINGFSEIERKGDNKIMTINEGCPIVRFTIRQNIDSFNILSDIVKNNINIIDENTLKCEITNKIMSQVNKIFESLS